MFVANVPRIAARLQSTAVQSSRQMSVISGPPQVRVSLPEKICHGLAIAFGVLAVPAWVLVNIKHYRANE